jgi:hypothetical protein
MEAYQHLTVLKLLVAVVEQAVELPAQDPLIPVVQVVVELVIVLAALIKI